MRLPALAALTVALMPQLVAAQGVTTAAIQGTVARDDGSPIAGATVRVTNTSNGRRWEVLTRSGGRFFLEDVTVGGPYRIQVRGLGFSPEMRDGIVLSLGQRLTANFTLRAVAIALEPVIVRARTDPILSAGRSGPAEVVSAIQIANTPNIGRDFLTLTTFSPQTIVSPSSGSAPTGGITIGGQNRLLNAFQIDGATIHDLYTGGLPGRETLPRPISLEAIQEIQVLAAPFDVRHGGFAGGLVNAVTRSGSNEVHGSVFGFLQNDALSGAGNTGKIDDFSTWQYGGTIGGPIVRDRAHFFLSVDVQRRELPDPGPLVTDVTSPDPNRVSYADAVRFQNILRDNYGLEPGTLGPVDQSQPAQDVFGKISIQLGRNNHLDLSHHFSSGEREGFAGRRARLYALSSTGQTSPSTANASRLIWTSVIGGRWSSESILSYRRLDDRCEPAAEYPAIAVGTVRGELWAGPLAACGSKAIVQDGFELTENLTAGFGGHVVTLGMHGEALRITDDLSGGARGSWTFLSLDDFEARRASRYARTLTAPARVRRLAFRARQVGVYVQDRWNATTRLALTLGLRLDLPVLPDAVATNDSLQRALGVDTGRLPGGSPLWSPRLGISYDLSGDGRGYLRGGVGLFTGRAPYTWLASAYRDNGGQELFLTCPGQIAPPFDPVNQPPSCTNGSQPAARFSFFDPDLKFPQTLKIAAGVDHRLPAGIVGTLDILYTRAVHQLYLTDANLLPPTGIARGEGNRPLYGTINAAGRPMPARRSTFDQVARISSRSGDNALSLSAQLRKRFGERLEASALYAFSRARDRMSLVNFVTRQNLEHTPLDGTLENRALRPSYFDVPHRFQLNGTARLPHGVRFSLLYSGTAGTPFTYVVSGDANADGIPTGQLTPDIVYVPRLVVPGGDVSLVVLDSATGRFVPAPGSHYAMFESLIRAEPCLREHRGRILARNSCRNPWFRSLNARLTKSLPTKSRHSLELVADMYNVLNLFNQRWGLYRVTAPTPAWPLLRLRGYDTTAERGIYEVSPPILRDVRDLEGRWSRWLMEASVRYVF